VSNIIITCYAVYTLYKLTTAHCFAMYAEQVLAHSYEYGQTIAQSQQKCSWAVQILELSYCASSESLNE